MKRFGRHFLKHRKGGCGCLGHHEASFDEIECFNGRESAEGGNFAVKSAGSKVGCGNEVLHIDTGIVLG